MKICRLTFKFTLSYFLTDAELSKLYSAHTVKYSARNGSSPYFDLDNSGNVTAVLGKAAYLNCRVKNMKNQTVRIDF